MPEDFFEGIQIEEIGQAVLFGLPHVAPVNEFPHDVANIIGGIQPPLSEHRQGHSAKLLVRQMAKTFQQFGATDMLLFRLALRSLQQLLGSVQSFQNKDIGMSMIVRPGWRGGRCCGHVLARVQVGPQFQSS